PLAVGADGGAGHGVRHVAGQLGDVGDALVAGDGGRGDDARLVGPEVVGPVPDRVGLVQDRGHAGVLAGLAALLVLVADAGAVQGGGGDDEGAGVAGDGHG